MAIARPLLEGTVLRTTMVAYVLSVLAMISMTFSGEPSMLYLLVILGILACFHVAYTFWAIRMHANSRQLAPLFMSGRMIALTHLVPLVNIIFFFMSLSEISRPLQIKKWYVTATKFLWGATFALFILGLILTFTVGRGSVVQAVNGISGICLLLSMITLFVVSLDAEHAQTNAALALRGIDTQ